MKEQGLIKSFNYAIEGFIYALKTQRNMRIHFLFAVFVLLLGIYFNFNRTELLILCAAITFVFVAEMVNTAMEMAVDMVLEDKYHFLAHKIKDMTAGAVMVASINAIIAGYLLFARRLPFTIESGLMKVRQSSWHVTFICLITVFAIVVMAKVFFHKGTPLRGGMPSGHSAVAFSMWMVISLMTNNGLIIVLSFVMALLIARSRLSQGIHTIWEIAAGGAAGTLATLLIFQLLR